MNTTTGGNPTHSFIQRNTGKTTFLFLLITISMLAQFCKPAMKASKTPPPPAVSYELNIQPIMLASCTPCHFPEKGQKKMLNTYEATKENITDILTRVQLVSTDEKFMPFKSKKTPLTEAEIKLFKDWVTTGMAK